MIRHRLDVHVIASAGQMDAALDDGLRAEVLAELVTARAQWHDTGVMPRLTVWARAALATAAARDWDDVFVHAARRYCASSLSSGE